MSTPPPTESVYPRFVTPGIETQNPLDQIPEQGMSCRPDWIRLVGPESQTKRVIRLLNKYFGPATRHNKGAIRFDRGTLWEPGVLLSEGHANAVIMVDLQGARLACTAVDEFMDLTSDILCLGFRCTRIDLAVDHVGMDLQLHKNALTSCNSRELCKIRSFADDSMFKSDGTPQRFLLKLGQRSSSVCVRIYDKGLQTQTLDPGYWERLEVEFKHDRAEEICLALVNAKERLFEMLWRYVIGALDFRICNGRTELDRRPRSQWWKDYIGQAVPLECSPRPKNSEFLTWWFWARASFCRRFLQFSHMLRVSPETLLAPLLLDLDPATSESPATADLRAYLSRGECPIILDFDEFEGNWK